MKLSTYHILSKQRGVILIVALIMLLIMTSIGITLMSGSTLQERMAGNNRQLTVARMNAQQALVLAEGLIEGMNIENRDDVETGFTGKVGYYIDVGIDKNNNFQTSTNPATADFSKESDWSSGTGGNAITASSLSTNGPKPMYTIEFIGRMDIHRGKLDDGINIGYETKDSVSDSPFMFRVTALGYDDTGNISAILQSTYSTSD